MSTSSDYAAGRNDILRRLGAIQARLDAVARRCRALAKDAVENQENEQDPIHRLKAIEATLGSLEEHLRQIETELRDKESPPETLGTSSQFSTGPHFPGLG